MNFTLFSFNSVNREISAALASPPNSSPLLKVSNADLENSLSLNEFLKSLYRVAISCAYSPGSRFCLSGKLSNVNVVAIRLRILNDDIPVFISASLAF
ncbi:hypothetical protein pCPXV0137 [Cowpox virus]|uniref:Uncharacterized protein n=1 Tax=Cowpox virus TaxID=10243 RepID=A0A212PTG8_COWPX|nr:hypothetical protein pCPXV0137 [Cowpox virus]